MAQANAVDDGASPLLTFGERLMIARRRAGLEQADMAKHFGVTAAAISKWEAGSGPRRPLEVARRWAEITHQPLGWLLGVSASGYNFDSPAWTPTVVEEAGQQILALGLERPALRSVSP